MARLFLTAGALLGGLAVAFGAFGAHALARTLAESGRGETFETAVRYQMYHALALLLVGLLARGAEPGRPLAAAGWCFIAGTVVFSGSLYVLCLTGVTRWGAVTPIGGLLLLAGWLALAAAALRL